MDRIKTRKWVPEKTASDAWAPLLHRFCVADASNPAIIKQNPTLRAALLHLRTA